MGRALLLTRLFTMIGGPDPPPGDVPRPFLVRQIDISGALTDAFGSPIDVTFVVPEPGAGLMAASGLAVLAVLRRRYWNLPTNTKRPPGFNGGGRPNSSANYRWYQPRADFTAASAAS